MDVIDTARDVILELQREKQQITAELINERDQLQQRVQELEESVRGWANACMERNQRIDKAREILEGYPRIVKEALEALEGKCR